MPPGRARATRRRDGDGSATPSTGGAVDEPTAGSPPETAVPPDPEASVAPSRDSVFEVLRTSRRRAVLRYLDANGGRATLDELAEHIAAAENGVAVDALTQPQRKRVYVVLYQVHLPKLDGFDVVDYDVERGVVALGPASRWCLPYLYFEPDADDGGRLASLRRLGRRLLGR